MNNKNRYLGAAVLGIVVLTFSVSGSVYASQGIFAQKKLNHSIQEFETYQDFLDKVGAESMIAEKISEEKFERIKNREFTRNDCPYGNKTEGNKQFHGKRFHRGEKRESIRAALESGNYKQWLELVGEKSRAVTKINENNFSRFVEMHKLMAEGNIEESRKIKEELGLEGCKRGERGRGGFAK